VAVSERPGGANRTIVTGVGCSATTGDSHPAPRRTADTMAAEAVAFAIRPGSLLCANGGFLSGDQCVRAMAMVKTIITTTVAQATML
jgi:hypothetical protein